MPILCASVHVQSILFSLVFIFLPLPLCLSRDTITSDTPISDLSNDKLVSANRRFELGFFTPTGSPGARRYVGIWYSGYSPLTVVWVANRDKPLSRNTGFFGLDNSGNISVWTSSQQQMRREVFSNKTIRLLDTGNLVISVGESQVLWQSFDYPTDTFLPGMKWQEGSKLTSWNAPDDPKPGKFTFEVDPDRDKQYVITKPDPLDAHWKSGVYAKLQITDVMIGVMGCLLWNSSCGQSNYSLPIINVSTVPRYLNHTRNLNLNDTRLVLDWTGHIQFYVWVNASGLWNLLWYQPRDTCSIFNKCGKYAICSSENSVPCECLRGCEPVALEEWKSGEFSAGCKRKATILCNSKEFKRFKNMIAGSLDGDMREAETEEKCKEICVSDCDCKAYYYHMTSSYSRVNSNLTRCWTWSSGLNNIIRQNTDGYSLNVRVGSADIEGEPPTPPRRSSSNKMLYSYLILIVPAAIAILILFVGLFYYRRRRPANENAVGIQGNPVFRFHESEQRIKEWISSSQFREEDKKGIDVPFFDLEIILAATDNFSDANKLGQGGFGPVYKGTFPGGQEIAIKRLSSASGQGLEELKNEVMLIAKLQHRNLVRLMGYCIEGEEKILLYEYMPNGSLDSFIFDRTRCFLLTWELRFEIILGIARGMLYLHQDSRLRIIHRDMKSSNVLLDEEMNPKISDFGLARIFESKQTEATTKRVIGTYGYMSPEYALDGFFSFKSDVFSYGVVVLEIISGKRNTAFYQSIGTLNLISHAWKFWSENNALNLMDHALRESCITSEVLKCINVALLCVQEDPIDRPTMSNILYMLGSESATLPTPKKPGFAVNRSYSTTSSSSKAETICEMSTTIVQGR